MSADFAEPVNHPETTMSEDSNSPETLSSPNEDASIHADDVTPDATPNPGADQPIEAQVEPDIELTVEPNGNSTADEPLPNHAVETEALHRLATENESLRFQVEERTSQCMRIAADFDNFRKRTDREKSDLELRVKRDAISELLPVIDSFERARIQIKPQSEAEDNIQKSYQGVYKQLVDCLKRIGVARMKVEGQPFDPNYHDAVMREPTDQHPEGTVIEELRRGYLLGDLVLRHAMVKVAAPPEELPISDAGQSEEASVEAS